MRRRSKILVSIIILLFFGQESQARDQQPVDYYTKGIQAAQKGNYEKALEIWLQAKGGLDVPSTRIGTAFIELVAEQELTDYYEFATLMYDWGLSASRVGPNKEALRTMVEQTGILTDEKTHIRWDTYLENEDPKIYKELRLFWKQKDPTPTSSLNERLIEHWQRIAYSRKHFTRKKSGPFSTDDRSQIFVRYGPPNRKAEGTLDFNESQAREYVQNIYSTFTGSTLPNAVSSGSSGTLPSETFERYVSRAEGYHQSPEFEVWIYDVSSQREEELIYLFGSAGGVTAGFKQIDTVEDLIPRSAFRPIIRQLTKLENTKLKNITPGLILQLMYYEQLQNVDPYFAHMLNAIRSRSVDANNSGAISAQLGKQMQTGNYRINTTVSQKLR